MKKNETMHILFGKMDAISLLLLAVAAISMGIVVLLLVWSKDLKLPVPYAYRYDSFDGHLKDNTCSPGEAKNQIE